jgi:hypothetical protein
VKVIQNYTLTFNFVKKNPQTFKKHIELQSQAINVDKNNTKKSLHILGNGASGVQVGVIEQAFFLNAI